MEGQAQVFTTPNGLNVGIYCDYNGYYPDREDCVAAIQQLKADGAEYIICMFHWGQDEVVYHPKQVQIDLAHACIDAGADFIYGSHSHCLQPIEEYNGGIILYSIGNWSFGGNTTPKDMDTAIFQVKVKRDLDGSISNDGYTIIPCCISSRPVLEGYMDYGYNDFCPTPYEEGTELYARAMSKILGTYEGPDGMVDYSNWNASYGGLRQNAATEKARNTGLFRRRFIVFEAGLAPSSSPAALSTRRIAGFLTVSKHLTSSEVRCFLCYCMLLCADQSSSGLSQLCQTFWTSSLSSNISSIFCMFLISSSLVRVM